MKRSFFTPTLTTATLTLIIVLILTALPLAGTATSPESRPLLNSPHSANTGVTDAADMADHSAPLLQGTEVCGPISEDTTWTLAASPYVVTCNVTLAEDVTLSIEPGVVVKFDSGTRLYVGQNATLTAMGAADHFIYFTSIKDDAVGGDTNGDGDASEPSPGDWRGIKIEDGGALHMDYGHVRYVGHSGCYDCGAVVVWGDAFIDHSVIDNVMDGAAPGVEISHYSGTPASVTIQNTTIRKSRGAVVWGYVIDTVYLLNNMIEVEAEYGSTAAFDLGCWAGSGSAEEVRIRDNQITFTPDENYGGTAVSVCNVQQGEISNNTLQAVGNSHVLSKGIYVSSPVTCKQAGGNAEALTSICKKLYNLTDECHWAIVAANGERLGQSTMTAGRRRRLVQASPAMLSRPGPSPRWSNGLRPPGSVPLRARRVLARPAGTPLLVQQRPVSQASPSQARGVEVALSDGLAHGETHRHALVQGASALQVVAPPAEQTVVRAMLGGHLLRAAAVLQPLPDMDHPDGSRGGA